MFMGLALWVEAILLGGVIEIFFPSVIPHHKDGTYDSQFSLNMYPYEYGLLILVGVFGTLA